MTRISAFATATAVASLLLGCAVKRDVAMTGEITLRGTVMPVGGIKEKLLAAHRAGMRTILIPSRNERDLDDIPSDVRKDLDIHLVKRIDDILPLVLSEPVAPPPKSVPTPDGSTP